MVDPKRVRTGHVRGRSAPAHAGDHRSQEGHPSAAQRGARRWSGACACWPNTACANIEQFNKKIRKFCRKRADLFGEPDAPQKELRPYPNILNPDR